MSEIRSVYSFLPLNLSPIWQIQGSLISVGPGFHPKSFSVCYSKKIKSHCSPSAKEHLLPGRDLLSDFCYHTDVPPLI